MELERTWSTASAGIRHLHDTAPREGQGGVRGTGKALPFDMGGFCSSGCSGCLPLAPLELTVSTSLPPSTFFSDMSASLLAAMDEGKAPAEEPSPKSVAGYDLGEGLQEEARLHMEQLALSEARAAGCATQQPR